MFALMNALFYILNIKLILINKNITLTLSTPREQDFEFKGLHFKVKDEKVKRTTQCIGPW